MALPVAPLGQLPSMNMPYSRPYYEKSSAVDKALTAFLTGMMANIGSQAAENVMQRDFAADPAGFWSKLAQGPKQNRQQYEAQAARTAEEAALQKQLMSREQIAEADRLQRAGEVERRFADSERDRTTRMSLGEMEMQQRSQQAQYEAEQRRRLAEFMAGNELTQIDARANAQMRAAEAAGRQEAEMRKGLLGEEYRLKGENERQAYDRMMAWARPQEGQPGQPVAGRKELSPAELEAMKKSSSSSTARETPVLQPALKYAAFANSLTAIPATQMAVADWLRGRQASQPTPATQPAPAPVPTPVVQPQTPPEVSTYTEPSFFGTDRSGALNQERVIAAAKAMGMTVEELLRQPGVIGKFLMDAWNPNSWNNPQSRPQ